MKAKLDRETKGKKRLTGLSIQLKGRIRGVDRSKKMQLNWGKLSKHDQMTRIDYKATAVNTKHGTLGVRIICAIRKSELTTRECIQF